MSTNGQFNLANLRRHLRDTSGHGRAVAEFDALADARREVADGDRALKRARIADRRARQPPPETPTQQQERFEESIAELAYDLKASLVNFELPAWRNFARALGMQMPSASRLQALIATAHGPGAAAALASKSESA
jgi:hypothetical protein